MIDVASDPQALINAWFAGWDISSSLPPFAHGVPPAIDLKLGHNGIHPTRARRIEKLLPKVGSVSPPAVLGSLLSYKGFVEGPHNKNPWTEELGIGDASYCCAYACLVPYHLGYSWWPESQFGVRGDAYVPYRVMHAIAHGEWQYDHSSQGQPCDLQPLDQSVFVWPGGARLGDHIETVVDVFNDGTFNDVGANTGIPEGVHYPVRRNRVYLLGRIRPSLYSIQQPPPQPVPQPQPQPGDDLNVNWAIFTVKLGSTGQWVKNLQGLLSAAGRPLTIDGQFGPATDAALRDWQQAAGQPGGADGVAGEWTWRYLTGFH